MASASRTKALGGLVAGASIGATGAALTLFAAGSTEPLAWLAVAGLLGGLVGRGWTGLAALLGGAVLASGVLLAAWPLFDPGHAHDVPLAALIMAAAVPALCGGGYVVVRGLASILRTMRAQL